MHPELFTLPIVGVSIKSYGFCLMVGFLTAVWFAMRRAQRVKANPDTVLDMAFLALLFGVGGARVFYVVHYWESQFANRPNPLMAVIDITGGGLEFLGGFLGAAAAISLYAVWKKVSVRLYLDILAPGAMWGLAFGRLGCFFNGCCFGGLCAAPTAGLPEASWAVRFPFASPAHYRQWEEREVSVPAELIVTSQRALQPMLLPASLLSQSVEKREGPNRRYRDMEKRYEEALASAPEAESTSELATALQAAEKTLRKQNGELGPLRYAQKFPSRQVPTRHSSVSELEDLASQNRSLFIHPTQLYSAINAMLLSAVLSAVFYLRKRHGIVIGMLFVLYPLPRALLEMIRVDNPQDVAGLTISQSVSLGMLILGSAYLFVIYRYFPMRSPALSAEMARRDNA